MAFATFILIYFISDIQTSGVHGPCHDQVIVKAKFKVEVNVTFTSFKIEITVSWSNSRLKVEVYVKVKNNVRVKV